MKLIKLTMQAFGPYKDKVEIDFNSINEGLLLITGDTGSGKTTIFDAICFALYGDTSTTTRKSDTLRSDFVSENTETYVELDFIHNGKKYYVRRTPKHLRKKKNSEEYRDVSPTAYFSSDTVSESTPSAVTSIITELLGLDSNQFKQVCMLSQGEFSKLLLSKPEEKTLIFRKIFDTNNIHKFTDILKDKFLKKKYEYDSIEMILNNEKSKLININYIILSNEELINVIESLSNEYKKEIKVLKDNQNKNNKFILDLSNKINNQKHVNDQIIMLNDSISKLEELENININMDALKDTYEYNKKAFEKLIPLKNNIDSITIELNEIEESLINNTNLLKDKEKLLLDKQKSFELIESYPSEIEDISKRKKIISEEHSKLIKLDSLIKEYSVKTNIIKTKILESKKYSEIYIKSQEIYYNSVSYVLASSLKDKEPCPVCGSITHPNKAIKSKDEITKEQLEEYKNTFDSVELSKRKLEIEIESVNNEINAIKESINIEDINNIDDLISAKINELNTLENEYESKSKLFKSLINERDSLNKEKVKYSSAIETLNITKTNKIKILDETTFKLNNNLKTCNTTLEELETKTISEQEFKDLEVLINEYNNTKLKLNSNIALLKTQTDKKEYKDITKENELLLSKQEESNILESNTQEKMISYDSLNKSYISIKELIKDLDETEEEYLIAKTLSDTANGNLSGKQRITFENYVQSYYLTIVLNSANQRLLRMTDNRYELHRKNISRKMLEKLGLEFVVFDAYTGKERDITTLSGGEMFKASLSLALGLSDVISSYAGGIKMDALFIDEGFGSLDSESLDQAINTLSLLAENNKLIGIISHVNELMSRIDNKIIVTKTNSGSKIDIVL